MTDLEASLMRLGDDLAPTESVMMDVADEMDRQDAKWGDQSHLPNGTGTEDFVAHATHLRRVCDMRFEIGDATWTDILLEEVYEALAESDPGKLRAELIQAAAVIVQWVASIDKLEGKK
jgi:hypothetical protein